MDRKPLPFEEVSLNPRQQEAVTLPVGPALILAGPGTGKTRVLTERIRHLVQALCVPPDQILALTFTNKAAGEMGARLARSIGEDLARTVVAGTFHRFCIDVLREHGEAAGVPRHFGIADEDLQRTLLYRACPRLAADGRNLTNALRHVQDLRRRCRKQPGAALSEGDRQILRAYEAELDANRLVDFDRIVFLVHDLFRDRAEVLDAFRQRFRHILVDEFQDTDLEQYGIVRALAIDHRSLFAVADDEQSIYGWRNADPENIRRFREDFLKGAAPVVLDRNYRSSDEILRLARGFIAKNATLYPRQIRAHRHGAQVRGLTFDTSQEEGAFLVRDIRQRLDDTPDLAHRQVAVLYPRHAVGAELERIFMENGVPCQMAHGRGLFDQPVLRRALSVLRYALNGDDDASLEAFLKQELDAADPALYPAIRTVQAEEGSRGFKQAAFRYIEKAPQEEAIEVGRAIGLAGTAANAARQGSAVSLRGLVDDLLDQVNTSALPSLKNHLHAVRDPLRLKGLPEALARVRPLCRTGGRLYVACRDEVLRALLADLLEDALRSSGVTVRAAAPGDRLDLRSGACVLSFDREAPSSAGPFVHVAEIALQAGMGPVLAAFKLCQAIACDGAPLHLPDYTAFDIETTALDLTRAEIVELGAVRVRGGREVDAFSALVRPEGGMSPDAQKVHGISADEVAGAPPFVAVYPGLRDFIGDDVLVAHNGYAFDFRVLNQQINRAGCPRLSNPTLDTLPMAQSYSPGAKNSIDALCERHGIPAAGARHRALDDARTLHSVFEALKRERASRYRRTAHERLLDRVALGMLFQAPHTEGDRFSDEEDVHFNLGAQRLLGPSGGLLHALARRFPRLDADRLREQVRMWLQAEPKPEVLASYAPDQVQRFRDLAAAHGAHAASLREAIRGLLDFADLYRAEDEPIGRDAVALLTLHAAKGLEFREVYLCGLEDHLLPGGDAADQRALEERRRLLYVGITRAMDRLTLTCARRRFGQEGPPSRFWSELSLDPQQV